MKRKEKNKKRNAETKNQIEKLVPALDLKPLFTVIISSGLYKRKWVPQERSPAVSKKITSQNIYISISSPTKLVNKNYISSSN